jgi:ornithine cyclodeaminase/alanine dehydrogenase-like protein (mu-crystallin family)
MRIVAAEEIDAVLNDRLGLVDALAEAFRADHAVPIRHHHAMMRAEGEATLLLMPAWTAPANKPSYAVTKIVTVFPQNGLKGLPSVYGSVLLLDGETGLPLAMMDGARLTLHRTAAASALASRFLSRENASRLVMVGAGALAPHLIAYHCTVRPIRHVMIWNRDPAKAKALALRLTAEATGSALSFEATEALEAAVSQADIVSCATLSQAPLIRGEWLHAGQHLDLVGAFNLSMRETDDTALQRADVYVDTKAALSEGGDVAVAIKSGTYRSDQVRGTLFDLARGLVPGRQQPGTITLFKSIGTALEDLAAAMHLWRGLAPKQGDP